jgi:hypothetical protein
MAVELASTLPAPLQILVDWANSQDHWVRAIVSEVLATRGGLSEEALGQAYQMFLIEKELAAGTAPQVAQLDTGAITGNGAPALLLTRVADVKHVNALAPDQEIRFNPRMTLLFGENATGKTGYVRILKRLAAVRSAEQILRNIHAGDRGVRPAATVEYLLDQHARTLAWNDEAGVAPFTAMNVFDSRAVPLHVDEDLTYVYTPAELALFRFTHEAIDAVRGRLDAERQRAATRGNPFLPRFARETAVYAKIEALGPSTDLAELVALANVSAEEAAGLEALREQVDALRPQSLNSRLQMARGDRDLFESVRAMARAVRDFDWDRYNGAVEDHRVARERQAAATASAFERVPIPGVLSKSWETFVRAAEGYLQHIARHDYPQPADQCIYCRQELGTAALELLRKYREYCNDALGAEVKAAAAKLADYARRLSALRFDTLGAGLARKVAAIGASGEIPAVVSQGQELVRRLQDVHTLVTASAPVDVRDSMDAAGSAEGVAFTAIGQLDGLITQLTAQSDERQRLFADASARLRNLEARLTLQALFAEIRDFVERAKWANRAGTLLTSRIPPLLRSLTEASKRAGEQLLNHDFERLFAEECAALRAPRVTLDFPGRRGEPARRKVLTPEHRLSAVLSEGEQKVIALADFLAEAALRNSTTPIVLDDPVTSLDHRRLEYVVDRLVSLSEKHQVIVFTHDIWFAVELLARFEKATDGCTYYNVSESGGTFGIVNQGVHPRWDTVKQTTARINRLLQEASAASGEAQAALVEKAYDVMRAWCELVVEQELLAGVTQRFQANVAMTKLPQIKADRLPAAVAVIFPAFEKACGVMAGHSQPLATLGTRPTLDELKEDWKALEAARRAYISD